MLSRSVALTMLVAFATPHSSAAQNGGEIRGRIVSAADQTPIGNATVDVRDSGASAPAARSATDVDGSFRVQGLRSGRYRVRIVAIGYLPRVLPTIEISASSPSIDLGTVTLTVSPVALQSIQVTGQQQEAQFTPDRNTYVVRDMPTTSGGTALDVLRSVPAVDVDLDNIVSLRGNAGVVVQINGRPSPLKPAQLGNFLAQLPAAMVDKVEVIPNPSARDNPDGVAGIINLLLKQSADEGRSGGLTVGGGTTGHVDVGGNLGLQSGPLTFFGSYGFLRDRRPRNDSIYRENTYLDPITYLAEGGNRLQVPYSHTFTGSLGYKPGSHDELSADVTYSKREGSESNSILYRDLNAAHDITALSDRLTSGTAHQSNFEGAIDFKHSFAKGHKLSGEVRAVREEEGGPSTVVGRALTLAGLPADTSTLENQASLERPYENSAKLDYTRPLSSHLRLEVGYKGSQQGLHTTLNTQVFDTLLALYAPDSTRISDFTYDQVVHAGYAMLSGQAGSFLLQGGVRVEHAATAFHLTTLNATYSNPYSSVFPSGLIAYNIDDSHQVKLSYSTRIRRPDDTDVLDPTRRFQDPLNISIGNPYLKPEYIRAVELGLQRSTDRMTIQVTPFFRHTIDAVRQIRTLDSAGVTTRTYANVSTSDAYGADANIVLSGTRLSGSAGASAFRQVSDAANLGPGLSIATFGWTARTNTSFRVSSTIDVQALVSYQAPMTVEQGHNASRTRFTFAARQKVMNDQMSLTLRVVDPFNTSLESSTTIDPRFVQETDRRRSIRGVLLSVTWNFGRPKEKDDTIDLGGSGN